MAESRHFNRRLKFTIYLAYAISLIFIVMGILILSGIFFKGTMLGSGSSMRYIFGSLLLIYGSFRGYKAYLASKRKPGDDDETGYTI